MLSWKHKTTTEENCYLRVHAIGLLWLLFSSFEYTLSRCGFLMCRFIMKKSINIVGCEASALCRRSMSEACARTFVANHWPAAQWFSHRKHLPINETKSIKSNWKTLDAITPELLLLLLFFLVRMNDGKQQINVKISWLVIVIPRLTEVLSRTHLVSLKASQQN